MATNCLIVGTATNGPCNLVTRVDNLAKLKQIFGGDYVQTEFITATASSVVLDYPNQSSVKNESSDGRTGVLYRPTVQESTMYFGSIGGTGDVMDFTYTPYLGDADLLNASNYLLDNGAAGFYVCRIGGSYASIVRDGWSFMSNYKGLQFNDITLTTTATSIIVDAFQQFPTRTYTGEVEDMVKNINSDSSLGIIPFYIAESTQTPTIFTSVSMTGGLNGVIDYNAVNEFINSSTIPPDVTHVFVLGPVDSNILDLLNSSFLEQTYQLRIWGFQAPSLDGAYPYYGANTAETAFKLQNPGVGSQSFEGFTHNTSLSVLQSCSVSPTGLVIDRTQSGYGNNRVHGGTKGLQLFPNNTFTTITLTPPSTGYKINSLGFWLGSGEYRLRVKAYSGNEVMFYADSLTGVASGTAHFMGLQFKKPATKVTLSGIQGAIPSRVTLDDVYIGVVTAAGSGNNLDDVLAYIRGSQIKHPMVALFGGDCFLQIGAQSYKKPTVLAAALVTLQNNGLLTNKSAKVLGVDPVFSEDELELAYLNGINLFRRWIGSGIAVDKGVCLDTTFSYSYTTRLSEISSVATIYLRKFIGFQLQRGYQQNIATELKTKLAVIEDVTIEDVVVDYMDGVMRVFIEGLIYGEILKISFNVRTA